MSAPDESRRALLRGAVAVGLAGATGLSLTGCGENEPAATQGASPSVGTTPVTPTPRGSKRPKPAKPERAKQPKASATAEPTPTASAVTAEEIPQKTTAPKKPVKLIAKGEPVAAAAEVPVGSGSLYEFQDLIVTQPTAGTFHGFSPLCTHQGCVVDVFEADTMVCTCHDSVFRITDGSVVEGPAKRPMRAKPIVVKDGQIYHAVAE